MAAKFEPELVLPVQEKPEFAQLLGVLIERWTWIDALLCKAVGCLIGDDETKEVSRIILYSLNSAEMRIQITRNLTNQLAPHGPEKADFLKILNKLRHLSTERNGYIHNEYHWGKYLERRDIRPSKLDQEVWMEVSPEHLRKHISTLDFYAAALRISLRYDTTDEIQSIPFRPTARDYVPTK